MSSPSDNESGYASGSSSEASLPDVYFSSAHLKFLNRQLQKLSAEEVLRWCMTTLPGLYQTTAFGLSGLVTLDMLSKISASSNLRTDLIFLDTLHHFSETLSLVDRVRTRYPHVNVHLYQPDGLATSDAFAAKHGDRLWETNDELYDWLAKVEPQQRAYAELNVKAVLTGRRRAQGGKRGDMDIIEVDDAGVFKVNPLANWSFADAKAYIDANHVPYNELLDRGYKSVGDWHSTTPINEDEDERAGRWKGQAKTECGIHNKRSQYAQYLQEMEQKQQQEELSRSLEVVRVDA